LPRRGDFTNCCTEFSPGNGIFCEVDVSPQFAAAAHKSNEHSLDRYRHDSIVESPRIFCRVGDDSGVVFFEEPRNAAAQVCRQLLFKFLVGAFIKGTKHKLINRGE